MLTKEERLSFRLDIDIGKQIDTLVDSRIGLRNRSDFGKQAIQHYFDIIEEKPSSLLMIITAIEKICAKITDSKFKELVKIKKIKKELLKIRSTHGFIGSIYKIDSKDDRLSFRITKTMDLKIDSYVDKFEGISHRSEFGSFAMNSFIYYIQLRDQLIQLIGQLLKKLAKKVGVPNLPEIEDLELLLF